MDWVLESLWIKNDESISIKKALGRSWFTKIFSKDLGQIWLLATKWADSTKTFIKISDYYLWWTDIWDKIQARWVQLKELSKISWDILWKYKTELLLLIWLRTLNRIIDNWWNISNSELDQIATKFTPTLTKKVIEQLPEWMKKPVIDTVDSNSELVIQVLEYLSKDTLVWWVEIVQSGNSLVATNNAIIHDNKIILPSKRNIQTWEFEWKIITEVDPESQIWIIWKKIQSSIDIKLYENTENNNNKPKEFIKVIEEEMWKINSRNN